jgi:peptide chain release factor 1
MEMLRIKLYDRQRSVQDATRKSSRQSQIGQAERSDKIRTYNFPQARITDHRLGVSIHGLETFFAGKALDQFIDQMVLKEEEDRISELEQL